MTTIISISVVQNFLSCRSAFKRKGKISAWVWDDAFLGIVLQPLCTPQQNPASCELAKYVLKITSYPKGDTKIKSTNIHRIVILAQAHRD